MPRIAPFARFFLLALLSLPALGSTPAGHIEIRWDERGGAALRTPVAPGKFVEWCGHFRVGELVNWEFESAEPLDINVHYREGRNVHHTVKRDAVLTWAGTLQASVDQLYCWMWTNRGTTPVALHAYLQKPPAAAREPR